MKLPVWIWDPRAEQYVRLPLNWLQVYPDDKIGFETVNSGEESFFFSKYNYLFKYDKYWCNAKSVGLAALMSGRWLVKTRKPTPCKGPKWYSQEKHQIKGFQK